MATSITTTTIGSRESGVEMLGGHVQQLESYPIGKPNSSSEVPSSRLYWSRNLNLQPRRQTKLAPKRAPAFCNRTKRPWLQLADDFVLLPDSLLIDTASASSQLQHLEDLGSH